MQLTPKQRDHINRYMRDVAACLGDMPDAERQEVVGRLRRRIERELSQYGDTSLRDGDVEAVLKNCGLPAAQASALRGRAHPAPDGRPSATDRVWLGVCGGLARRVQLDANILRFIVVLLGLIPFLLPFLLLAYVGAYLVLYYTSETTDLPPIHYGRLTRTVLTTFLVALALFAGSEFVLELAHRLLWRFLERTVSLESRWDWLELNGNALFFWVLVALMPLAAISALPVSEAWAGTLKKMVHAALALYAIALCFGIACFLAGIAMDIAQDLARSPILQSLP